MIRRLTQLAMLAWMGVSAPAVATNALLEIQESHWLEAMRIGRVNSEVLYAISLQESGTSFNGMRKYGPWPWTMNINEEARYYSSREAARKALKEELKAGNERVAVGMWQIYLRYNAHYVEDPLDLIDPVTNLFVAAKVLRGCGDIYDTTREVLSCYYSGNVDEAGLAYADRVLALAHKWGKPYRMRHTPAEVLYTHHETADPSIENAAKVILIDGSDNPDERPLSMAALTLAPSRDVPTHSEFIEDLNEPETAYVHRVIVVE